MHLRQHWLLATVAFKLMADSEPDRGSDEEIDDYVDEAESANPKFYADTWRNWLILSVIETKIFERCVLFVILANCVFLGFGNNPKDASMQVILSLHLDVFWVSLMPILISFNYYRPWSHTANTSSRPCSPSKWSSN